MSCFAVACSFLDNRKNREHLRFCSFCCNFDFEVKIRRALNVYSKLWHDVYDTFAFRPYKHVTKNRILLYILYNTVPTSYTHNSGPTAVPRTTVIFFVIFWWNGYVMFVIAFVSSKTISMDLLDTSRRNHRCETRRLKLRNRILIFFRYFSRRTRDEREIRTTGGKGGPPRASAFDRFP